MIRTPYILRPDVRRAHAENVRREQQLEHDRVARVAALECMKLILEKPCTIMDLKHVAFPGLFYALRCGWVTKTDSFYELTTAGNLMFPKLEQPRLNSDALPSVLLKARQLTSKIDLERDALVAA